MVPLALLECGVIILRESTMLLLNVFVRFDNEEVLGDRISLTFYKDLRRARGMAVLILM